jgi:hypothetical protein
MLLSDAVWGIGFKTTKPQDKENDGRGEFNHDLL